MDLPERCVRPIPYSRKFLFQPISSASAVAEKLPYVGDFAVFKPRSHNKSRRIRKRLDPI